MSNKLRHDSFARLSYFHLCPSWNLSKNSFISNFFPISFIKTANMKDKFTREIAKLRVKFTYLDTLRLTYLILKESLISNSLYQIKIFVCSGCQIWYKGRCQQDIKGQQILHLFAGSLLP